MNKTKNINKTKKIYIVLSRSSTALSQIIHLLKGDQYTHAALALDRELDYMFSFGRRRASNPFIGCFKRESLQEGLYQGCETLPGMIIEIPVSEEQYEKVASHIEEFLLNSCQYGYNYWGLLGNIFCAPRGTDKKFFCSEFVYHVLHKSGIADLQIPYSLVRPQDLLRIEGKRVYEGDLKAYAVKPASQQNRSTRRILQLLPYPAHP